MLDLRNLAIAGWLLVVTQLVHGAVPADTDAEGVVGFYAGIALLVASIVGAAGATVGKPWSPPLLGWTGLVVAVGFVLYHAVPISSPLTNPYAGEGVGLAPWLTVVASVAAGVSCALVGLRSRQAALAA